MGIVLVDAWCVARLEVRRYFRWRPLRRWLAGGVLLSLVGSLAAMLVLQYVRLPQPALHSVFALWYNLPVLAGLSAVLSLTPRLINDRTKRGMLIDLYLTSLHPMGIVLGKVVAATLLAGWLMLATLPPCALIVPTFQISPLQWLQGMLSGWFSLLLPAALIARLQWRALPEGASPLKFRLAPTMLGAALWATIMLALFALLYGFSATAYGMAVLASLSLVVPFGVALYASSTWTVGNIELPVVWVASALSVCGALVLSAATAQWLGWWSQWGYLFQRVLGSAVFAAIVGLWAAFGTYAHSAEWVYHRGMLYATAATYIVARYALGIWGVGRPCSPAEGWLALLREHALLWLCATGMYVGIGVAQGVWLNVVWAMMVAFYYGSLLAVLHAVSWEHIQERACAIRAGMPLSATQQTTYELHSLRGTAAGCVVSTLYLIILLRHVVQPPLSWIFYYPILITPLGGLLSPHFSVWAYGVYSVYALVIAYVLGRAVLREEAQQSA